MSDEQPAPKILAVDDVAANLVALRAVLAPLGGDALVTATSGAQALEHLLRDEFAVVLLDVMMPGMSGLEVARMMRARERTRAVPIIFLTAREPNHEDVLRGYLHGAADYLIKPFDPDVLRAKVGVFLDLHRAREAARALARQEERTAQAQRDLRRLRALLMNAPVAVGVIGDDYVFELANERFCRLANRPNIEGKSLVDVFPELNGSPLLQLLDGLMANPRPFSASEFPISFDRNGDGRPVQAYFDFNIEPLRDDNGQVKLMGTALDVTDHVAARRAREEFIGIASHELKTPLTTLRLQCDGVRSLLAKGPCTGEDIAPRMDVVDRQLRRLQAMVDELLDFSRIAAGKLELTREEVDLAALVGDVVARVAAQLEKAGCETRVHAEAPVVGCWDRARLDQVVNNLLGNAMKYGKGRPIDITVEGDATRARLCVHDHGIGIPPEHQARIFERFERAVPERNYGGWGLGLWIVALIVEEHGGKIAVDSAPGEGATFTVELPRQSV